MKKLLILFAIVLPLAACCNCSREPIVAENAALIIPPHVEQTPDAN